MSTPVEVELKFRVNDTAAGLRAVTSDVLGEFRAASPIRSRQIEDRYVDTTDGAMARAGFVARLRQTPDETLVTVKSAVRRSTGRVHRRDEVESPATRSLVPAEWPSSAARSLVLELAGDATLIERVTIRQLRTQRDFADGETVVELSLDQVDVVAHGDVLERFVELEAELKSGDEGRLDRLSAILAADPAFDDATESKLERAIAAIDRAPGISERRREPSRKALSPGNRSTRPKHSSSPTASSSTSASSSSADGASPDRDRGPSVTASGDLTSKAAEAASVPPLVVGKSPGVTPDDSVAEAGRKVLRFQLARMLAAEAGTREGNDPEELHHMRVATRRMRAAWRVFGDGFRPGRTKRHRKRLREVASRLGAVRDLDVLIDAAEKHREGLPAAERRALEPLMASWRRARDDARTLLLRELDSDAYLRWVEEFRVFVQTDGSGALPIISTEPHRIRDTAPQRIWAAYEHVRAYEPVLRWADVPTLHELRIAAKWLRYTMEFVREALGPDVAPLIERVTALQDHVGHLHDADVAASMGRSFLVEHAGGLSELQTGAIGRYLVASEKDVLRLRRSVGVPWRAAAGLAFRRRLGRVTAAL
jgi:CHAD domain-containing protein